MMAMPVEEEEVNSNPLSYARVKAMEIGQEFETPSLLAGITTTDRLKWRLVEMNEAATDFVFDITFLGIKLGSVSILCRKVGVAEIEEL